MDSAKSVREIVVSCVLAGTGMICAGSYLDWIKEYYASQFDPRLLAIVPPLIGLKGNLEVTLSSRLSTLINLRRNIENRFFQVFLTTLVYILMQAIIAGCVISALCILLLPDNGDLFSRLGYTFRLMSICILTCCFSICCLSSLVFALILCCALFNKDPDNIAPPAAAALGDFATVTLLLYVNNVFSSAPVISSVISILSALGILIFGPIYLTTQNRAFNSSGNHRMAISWHAFISSLWPLFGAISMSSLSGQILAHFAPRLSNLTRLQIAINGVGGCFGSVVISRMITRLHAGEKKLISPPISRKCPVAEPFRAVTSKQSQVNLSAGAEKVPQLSLHSTHTVQSSYQVAPEVEEDANRISRFILWICMPIHLFLTFVSISLHRFLSLNDDSTQLRSVFSPGTLIAYLLAGFTQIYIVLKFAKWIVLRYGRYLLLRPHTVAPVNEASSTDQAGSLAALDLAAVALTTGLGDFIGSLCLVCTLHLFQS